jgi:phosphoribosylformylglycinamidine (FGAM) synthase-like enzyme
MARGEAGVDVRLDAVPLREEGLEPWEIVISESQERMVAVVPPERLADVQEVCDRWELHHAVIGEVTDTGELRASFEGEVVGEIPARFLTDECPRYEVERELQAPVARRMRDERLLPERLGTPNVRSRRWVWERYDQLVGSRTVRRPGLDAAVLRLRPSHRGLAVSLQGPRPGTHDPRAAGLEAVFGACRNVACAGGEPLALTDCLNFGNPEKPEIGWELAESIDAIAVAADALGIPVVSGNVSLYNETEGRAIPPTPVVGAVGLVADVRAVRGRWRDGDVVLFLPAEEHDVEAQARLIRLLWTNAGSFSLAHDVGTGGVEAALAEAALWSRVGAELGEVPESSGAIVACAQSDLDGAIELGRVGGGAILGFELEDLREANG